MRRLVGFKLTLKAVQLVDKFRNKNTPFEHPDNLIPLEKLGYHQANITGKELGKKNIIPDLILCSDYLRTRQTTETILKGIKSITGIDLQPKVLYSKLIVERNAGITEGFPKAYYSVLFPEINNEYAAKTNLEFRPPEGESILDVRYNRIPPLMDLINSLNFNTLFIVAHARTNACIRSLLTGEEMQTVKLGMPNLGVYRFLFNQESAGWDLDTEHHSGQPISDKIQITE